MIFWLILFTLAWSPLMLAIAMKRHNRKVVERRLEMLRAMSPALALPLAKKIRGAKIEYTVALRESERLECGKPYRNDAALLRLALAEADLKNLSVEPANVRKENKRWKSPRRTTSGSKPMATTKNTLT